jgi:hypothetical protein
LLFASANHRQAANSQKHHCDWLGNNPAIPGWTFWGTDGWHMNDAGYVMDGKGMLVWWDTVGLYQDVFGVVAGQTYEYSVSAITKATDKLKGWDLVVKAEWTAENWATIGGTEIGRFVGAKSESNPGDGVDTWKLISGTAVVPEGAAHGKIYFQLVQAGDWGYTGGSVCFDNASVVLVPEPATIVVLSLAGLFIRRRK